MSYLLLYFRSLVGRDSSVDTVTRCELDGPGIESRWRWGKRFSTPVQTTPGTHLAFYTMGTGSFPGVNRLARGVDNPPASSAQVQEREELYFYSPSSPSWAVLGWNTFLPFTVLLIFPSHSFSVNSFSLRFFWQLGRTHHSAFHTTHMRTNVYV